MALQDTVMGGVGANVQPKDNPDPSAAVPGAAAQTVSNSLPSAQLPQAAAGGASPVPPPSAAPQAGAAPQGTPGQAAQPNPFEEKAKKEDEDLDALVAQLGSKVPEKEKKKAEKSSGLDEFETLANDLGGETIEGKGAVVRKPGESAFDAAIRELPEALKFAGAQMRAHLGRDPKEQRAAFESMYGPTNVKVIGNSLYFRPEEGQKFRKIDEQLFNGMADSIIFNALRGIPAGANIVTQLGVDALTKAPPIGGAAGGAADAITQQGLISGLNQISDIPQDSANVKTEILRNAGLNALLPLGLAALPKLPIAKQAINKIYSMLKGEAEGAVRAAGEEVGKTVAIKNAFQQFKDSLFPQIAKSPEETGKVVGDAIDKVHDTLSKNVGLIKDEAVVLAKQQNKKVPMSNAMGRISEELKDYKYYKDPQSGFLQKLPNEDTSLLEPAVQTAAEKLATFHNRLAREADGGGADLETVFNDLDNLKNLSNFDQEIPRGKGVRNLYKSVRNAVTQDRNSALNDIYNGSGLPNENTWSEAFSKYHQNIDATGDFKAMFHSPQKRELLVDTLSKSSNADKNEMLDSIKRVLGEDSQEWNALRGEIYSNLVNRNTTNGVLDAAALAKSLTKPGNKPFLSRVFNDKEIGTLNRMTLEAQRLSNQDVIGEAQKNVILKGINSLIEMSANPVDAAKAVFSTFGNNKKAIDFLTDEGFLDLASKAQSPAIKKRIIDALRTTDAVRNKMQIIYPDKGVPRYIPLTGGALGSLIKNQRQGFAPQNSQ